MESFWVFLVVSVGLTHLIVDGSIFAKARTFIHQMKISWMTDLISCYQCAGVWSGVLCAAVMEPIPDMAWYLQIPLCAFAASFAAMVGAALLNWLSPPHNG